MRKTGISQRANRLLHAGAAAIMACGLAVCVLIKPDPSGVGTHRQLGLPGCLVCRVTGMDRCPSCGLTTGIAHLVRGHWQAAWATHRASPVVFAAWCAAMCYCLVIAAVGVDWIAGEILVLGVLCTAGFAVWLGSL